MHHVITYTMVSSIEVLTLGPAGSVAMVCRARVDQGGKHGKQDKPGWQMHLGCRGWDA